MRIPIIYTLSKNINQKEIVITGSDAHYLQQVLRLKEGNKVLVKTFASKYETVIINNKINKVVLLITQKSLLNQIQNKNNFPEINLYLSLIKPTALKSILLKITELGVDNFYPIETENSSLRLRDFNHPRYEKVVLAALKQSGRDLPLLIHPPRRVVALTREKSKFNYSQSLNLLADESTKKKISLEKIEYKSINLFVGPEGGLTLQEKKFLTELNFTQVTLSPFVLRVETAVLFLLAKVMVD